MPTEVGRNWFEFAPVEGRKVVSGFDGGSITSDGGAGVADRVLGVAGRFAGCFRDVRRQELFEHEVKTLVGQRVFGIALGYEDLNDHDVLRHDPVMAVLAGKLTAHRGIMRRWPASRRFEPSRVELSRGDALPQDQLRGGRTRGAVRGAVFLNPFREPPEEIILDLDATDDPLHGHQEGSFFHGYYDCYATCRFTSSAGDQLLAAKLRPSDIDGAAGSLRK